MYLLLRVSLPPEPTMPAAGYDLTGPLAMEIGQLSSLAILDLQHNFLSGTLPNLSRISSTLESIRLDENRLTGPIPVAWCELDATKDMILSNNDLTGDLPTCLSRLSNLEHLSVMHNEMTGTVPVELAKSLLQLQTIHVAGNQLHGAFPDSLCARLNHNNNNNNNNNNTESFLKEASADCLNILSPNYVPCSCCTKCCDGDGDANSCSLRDNLLGGDRGQ